MVKPQDVDTSNVADEQIGKCHKIIHRDGNFYMVESESDPLTEYKVTYDRKGFHCTCKSGQTGWANAKQTCKHVRWALACERETEEALEELQAATCAPVARTYTNVDQATRARIEAANERAATKPASRAKAPEYPGFSLLR